LSFEDILKHAATLPPRSAILFNTGSYPPIGPLYGGPAARPRRRPGPHSPNARLRPGATPPAAAGSLGPPRKDRAGNALRSKSVKGAS
jgi:hypothetical protein